MKDLRPVLSIAKLLDHFFANSQKLGLEADGGFFDNLGRVLCRVEAVAGLQINVTKANETGLPVEFVAEVAPKERDNANVVCRSQGRAQ